MRFLLPSSVSFQRACFFPSRRSKKGRTWMNLIRIFCPLRIKSDNGISFYRVKMVRERDWTVCLAKWHFSMSFIHLLKGQYLITDKIQRLSGLKQRNLSLPSLSTLTSGFRNKKQRSNQQSGWYMWNYVCLTPNRGMNDFRNLHLLSSRFSSERPWTIWWHYR